MKKVPKVTIVTINYNSSKDTIELLESIKKVDYTNYDIVILDNNSKESIEDLKKYKNIRLIVSKKNLGWTGGINFVLEKIKEKSKYYLFLNNDVIVDKNLIKELVGTAETYKAGFVGGAIYNYYSKRLDSLGGKFNFITGLAFPLKPFNNIRELKDKSEYFDSCVLLVNRDVIDKVGAYDNIYFMYVEADDWIFNARKKGFKVYSNPNAIVYHKLYGSSGGKKSKFAVYYLNRNRVIFMKKNTSSIRFVFFCLINFLITIQVLAILFLFRKQANLIPSIYKGSFNGIFTKIIKQRL